MCVGQVLTEASIGAFTLQLWNPHSVISSVDSFCHRAVDWCFCFSHQRKSHFLIESSSEPLFPRVSLAVSDLPPLNPNGQLVTET